MQVRPCVSVDLPEKADNVFRGLHFGDWQDYVVLLRNVAGPLLHEHMTVLP